MKLYGMKESGNCWKAATILALTGQAFEWVHTDGNAGDTQAAAFLAINPIGKVPALLLDDGTVLVESNAMLLHFGEDTAWLPKPGLERTRVHEWLFFEQYSHEPYIAVARNLITWQRKKDAFPDRLAECARKGAHALDVMERRLASHDWLAAPAPTVADLALFAYTHRADEGGFDLSRWPAVRSWVSRTAALPGITPLPRRDEVKREPVALLFSYGTLRQQEVQQALFGRTVETRPAALPGFALDWLRITDPAVIRTSGSDRHPILRRSADPAALVEGVTLAVSPSDIAAADAYEVGDYARVVVRLASGQHAYVYVASSDGAG